MKAIVLASLFVFSFSAFADDTLPGIEEAADEEILAQETAQTQLLETEPIDVDGYLKAKPQPVMDQELQTIQSEIQKQKKEIVLNKAKAQQFKVLGKSTEQLSETTEEMLLEKRAVQEEIANYNMKVKCLSNETPGPECDKFVRRRRE